MVHICHTKKLNPYVEVNLIGEGYQLTAILVGLEEAFWSYAMASGCAIDIGC